jgi:hypothetical protein
MVLGFVANLVLYRLLIWLYDATENLPHCHQTRSMHGTNSRKGIMQGIIEREFSRGKQVIPYIRNRLARTPHGCWCLEQIRLL